MDFGSKFTNIGIISPMLEEMRFIPTALLDAGWEKNKKRESSTFKFANIEVFSKQIHGSEVSVTVGFMNDTGQTVSAIETLAFLEVAEPKAIILSGIAGSMQPKRAKLGDVVIASDLRWRGHDRVSVADCVGNVCKRETCIAGHCEAGFKYNDREFRINYDYKSQVDAISKEVAIMNDCKAPLEKNRIFVSEVLSWNYALATAAKRDQLLEKSNRVVCVEMEAGGFVSAVNKYDKLRDNQKYTLPIVVRSICDYSDGIESRNWESDREDANLNAAKVSVELAEALFDRKRLGLFR